MRQLLCELSVPIAVVVGHRIVLANKALAALLGWSDPSALEGRSLLDFVRAGDADGVRERLQRALAGEHVEPAQVQVLRADGSSVVVEGSPMRIRFDGSSALLLDIRDLTLRMEAQEALRSSEARWRSLVQHGHDLIVVLAGDLFITYASPSAEVILARDPAELVGTDALSLVHPDDVASAVEAFAARVADPHRAHRGHRVRVRTATGGWRWLDTFATNLLHDPDVGGIVVNAWDVTGQVEHEQELLHLARHDNLTGLPNRVLFSEHLERALAEGRTSGATTGLLMLDLDRFKDVNDTLGHESGDRVLAELAYRLTLAVRADDVVGRIGGDEFAVVLPDAGDAATIEAVARRILEACAEPVVDGGMLLRVGASIGMVHAPEHGDEGSLLLRRVDAAMYRAKETRVGVFAAFEGDLDEGRRRLEFAGELRSALERGELVCEYQPKCSLVDGRVVGFEALVHWDHPTRGRVGPDVFLPDAEHLGLMGPLTVLVLGEALDLLAGWSAPGQDHLTMAVNVSATVLHDPRFVDMVDEALAASGADPTRLVLEVTEQAAMVQPDVSIEAMSALRARGIGFSIDDFGTGQSSLTYLRLLPVQEVKIDRSFIAQLVEGTPEAAIARSVVDLAHNLGMTALAEGIESEAVLALLRSYRCDLGQGWHLGRPVPASEVATSGSQRR
ncbi:MAG: EAL domain-containing protein [Acidimicrobiia bacterium]|nr:EAL domain-containing protein [Acidimicrobiia bacterium]